MEAGEWRIHEPLVDDYFHLVGRVVEDGKIVDVAMNTAKVLLEGL